MVPSKVDFLLATYGKLEFTQKQGELIRNELRQQIIEQHEADPSEVKKLNP